MVRNKTLILFLGIFIIINTRCIMDVPGSGIEERKIGEIFIAINQEGFNELLKNPTDTIKKMCSFIGIFNNDTVGYSCEICIHGGVSRKYPKKSFRLYVKGGELSCDDIFPRFPSKQGQNSAISQVILNANAIDFSNIRNFLSFYVSSTLGGIVPRIDFVELYINNNYYGLYSIIERVNDEMANNLIGHNTYDMLKSENHNGNFRTENYYYDGSDTVDSVVSPDVGFEIKSGDTKKLCEFVYWLESDSASISGIQKLVSNITLYSYFWGCYFSSDHDAMSKNFYFVYDKVFNRFELIRWDPDATFGRSWNGYQGGSIKFATCIEINGIYKFLVEECGWKDSLKDEYDKKKHLLSYDALNDVICNIEKDLEEAVYKDMILWNDTLLSYFTGKGWDYWSNISGDPYQMWVDELEIIRNFIRNRDEEIIKDLSTLAIRE